MEAKELINFSEVSVFLTGSKNVIRSNRRHTEHGEDVELLINYVQNWIDQHDSGKNVKLTIKTLSNNNIPDSLKEGDFIKVFPNILKRNGSDEIYKVSKYKDGEMKEEYFRKLEKAKEYLELLK